MSKKIGTKQERKEGKTKDDKKLDKKKEKTIKC
jgi:hypothetical protein